VLGRPPVDRLVLAGPHPFTPTELLPELAAGQVAGLRPIGTIAAGDERADLFDVDAAAFAAGADTIPPHLSDEAAVAWLDLAGAGRDAVERLLAARPIVSGTGRGTVLDRLGPSACVRPTAYDDQVLLAPAQGCPG